MFTNCIEEIFEVALSDFRHQDQVFFVLSAFLLKSTKVAGFGNE